MLFVLLSQTGSLRFAGLALLALRPYNFRTACMRHAFSFSSTHYIEGGYLWFLLGAAPVGGKSWNPFLVSELSVFHGSHANMARRAGPACCWPGAGPAGLDQPARPGRPASQRHLFCIYNVIQ